MKKIDELLKNQKPLKEFSIEELEEQKKFLSAEISNYSEQNCSNELIGSCQSMLEDVKNELRRKTQQL